MAKLQTEDLAKLVQKKLGLVVFPATLGDENGVVYDNPAARNGMVRIRYTTAAGFSLPPVVRMRATLPPNPGTSVLVGYDKQGELAVLEGDYAGMMAQGVNPLVMNAADPNVYGFTNTVSITTLLCFPRTTPNVNSTDVGVKAWIYVENDVWHYFPGELVALDSFIPSTGLHCVVGLYLKTDDTIETFASTPKSVLDPLTITLDVQEVHDQITAGSKPVWYWRLYGDQTAILDKDSFLDGRQFINVASSGGAGMTSFDVDADTGTAETIEDGDTLIIAGGTGIDTVVSATDTVTVSIDSSVVTLNGSQTLTNKTLTSPTINTPTISGGTIDNTPVGTTTRALGYFSALRLYIGGFAAIITHAFSADRTVTLPGDADVTLVGVATTQTLTNKTLTTPTIADFTNANHDHLDADDGGTLDAAAIASGTLIHERGGLEVDASAFAGFVKISGGATTAVARPLSIAVIEDQQAQNTAGGQFSSGAWRTRVLNTEVADVDGIVSLSSNQITLAAGTYHIIANAPANRCGRHQTRWQNVTDGTTAVLGTSEVTVSTTTDQNRSFTEGSFTIAGTKTFEFQHQCETTRITDGLGIAANFTTEVFARVIIMKEN